MKNPAFYIEDLDKSLKKILLLFIATTSLGYGFGLRYLYLTTEANPTTLESHYLGNEADEDAEIMKFKKTEKSILTFLHDHLFALGILQLIMSLLIYFTRTKKRLKAFLIYEPFISLLVTFSSIYLLWLGIPGLQYIVMITGTLFHAAFIFSLCILCYKLLKN
tara:strand:+ start:1094 stop:1582 length:489 start_codon:yes stop_codon:yes gene_type:complete